MKLKLPGSASKRCSSPAWFAGLGLIFVAILAGCRSGGNDQPSNSKPDEEIEPLAVGAATLGALHAADKMEQYELARDGWLTFSEYDQIAHTTMQCLTDVGAMIGLNSGLKTGNLWAFTYGAQAAVRAPAADCVEKYWIPLGTDWSFTHGPSKELLQEANEVFADCLREGGLTVAAEHPTADDFHVYTEAEVDPDRPETVAQWNLIIACGNQVTEQFNFASVFIGA